MRRSAVFRISIILFICGIALGSFVPGAFPEFPALVAIIGLATVATWQDRRSVLVVILCLACASGCVLAASEEIYWSIDRGDVSVVGTAEVVHRPEPGEYSQDVVLRFRSCEATDCPHDLVFGRFPARSEIRYGDIGTVSCTLEVPDDEWRMRYAKDGIAYRCRSSDWKKVGETHAIRRSLLRMSTRFESAIAAALPEPESSLAAGLLIGGDDRLPASSRQDFRDAGLTHIVAVSGYNISLIADYFLLFGIGAFLRRRQAAPVALCATLSFVFVAGAPPSAVRAFGMASTLLLAQWLGRRYASVWALLFAASVMLAGNPLLLRYDVGFLLSFLATAGIILSSPIIGRLSGRVPKPIVPFAEALLLTVAANLLILPVILGSFGRFAPVAIPANVALLPIVPFAMLFSFLTGIFGMMLPSFGSLFAFPAYAALHSIVMGAGFAASFGESAIETDTFGWPQAVSWYLAVVLCYLPFRRWYRNRTGGRAKKNRRENVDSLPV